MDISSSNKVRTLSSFLMRAAVYFTESVGFPSNYYCYTYFWTALFLSVGDIVKEHTSDEIMSDEFQSLISYLLENNPRRANLIGSLTEFQSNLQQAFSRHISNPRSSDGIAEILQRAFSIMYADNPTAAPSDEVVSSRYVSVLYDITEYTIALFYNDPAVSMLVSNLSVILSLSQEQRLTLYPHISQFKNTILDRKSMQLCDINDFIDHIYAQGYIVPSFDQYLGLGMDSILTHKIYVPKEYALNVPDWLIYKDWNAIKNAALNACILVTHEPSDPSIEDWNFELSKKLPGLFSTDNTDLWDILEQIVQVAEEGLDENTSLPEYLAQIAGDNYVSECELIQEFNQDIEEALRRFSVAINIPAEFEPNNRFGQSKASRSWINRFAAITQERKQKLMNNIFI